MKDPVFEGVATAIVTPFNQGTIDFPVMNRLLDLQLAAGVDAIVVCGTTGEASTMTDNEKLALIAHTVQYCAGRCKVIAGTGTNDTAHSLQLSRVAASMGADAVLMVTPYYNKCTQAGLIAHYTAAADTLPCPVIVYNVPSRTGVDVSVETCRVLAGHPNIGGIKEASGSVPKAAHILDGPPALARREGRHLRSVQRPAEADAADGACMSGRRLCRSRADAGRAHTADRRAVQ